MKNIEQQIKAIINDVLNPKSFELILYGSRAAGTAHSGSDYDVAIKATEQIPPRILAVIREQLEESNIPNKIDIVDYHNISVELKTNIDKDGIRW